MVRGLFRRPNIPGWGNPPSRPDGLLATSFRPLSGGDADGPACRPGPTTLWPGGPRVRSRPGPAHKPAPDALAGLTETDLRADPTLRPDVLDLCVAVELLIEVRHGITSRDMILSLGAPAASFDTDTAALAAASRLLVGR